MISTQAATFDRARFPGRKISTIFALAAAVVAVVHRARFATGPSPRHPEQYVRGGLYFKASLQAEGNPVSGRGAPPRGSLMYRMRYISETQVLEEEVAL